MYNDSTLHGLPARRQQAWQPNQTPEPWQTGKMRAKTHLHLQCVQQSNRLNRLNSHHPLARPPAASTKARQSKHTHEIRRRTCNTSDAQVRRVPMHEEQACTSLRQEHIEWYLHHLAGTTCTRTPRVMMQPRSNDGQRAQPPRRAPMNHY